MEDARNKPGASGCVNDQVFRSTGVKTWPNLLLSAGCNSEIAIFAANNAMRLETPVNTWTNSSTDLHTVTLEPIIDVPVSVWIADAAAGAMTTAQQHMARANLLYQQNKVGVKFVPTFTRVSGVPNVNIINNGIGPNASGNDHECKDILAVQQSAFYTAGKLNVYYVNVPPTSMNVPLKGRNCATKKALLDCGNLPPDPEGDGNITYIGAAANRASLAHEFGHAFGLRPGPCGGHTNRRPGFGPKNIMWAGGDGDRNRFTLGQVFRMNTHTDLWGGTMLIKNGLRQGPGRACPPLSISAICPALKKDWPRP